MYKEYGIFPLLGVPVAAHTVAALYNNVFKTITATPQSGWVRCQSVTHTPRFSEAVEIVLPDAFPLEAAKEALDKVVLFRRIGLWCS
jgi:hypothetical protein